MAIELSHIGEPLVGRMLAALAERGELDRVTCAVSGVSLTADLGAASPEFIVDRAVLRVHSGDQVFACDGAQTVDILAAAGDSATAMELKLGVTRMASGAFRERFCGPCGISDHADLRLTGSMVAVLDRRFPFAVGHVSAVDGHRTWRLADHWWLVIRQRVWLSWTHRAPVRSARVLVFDQLVHLYGGPAEFDQLVRDVVANDFAYRWEIDFDQLQPVG